MSGPLLDRATIERLFEELADELKFARARVQLYVIGGAAMSMSFDRDRTTQDVDARIAGAEGIGLGRTRRLTSARCRPCGGGAGSPTASPAWAGERRPAADCLT